MLFGFGFSVANAQLKAEKTAVSNVNIKNVNVSPNPATSLIKVTIEGKQASLRSISIYSIIGNEVFNQMYNSTAATFELDIRNLKKGKYLVRVMFDDNTSEVVTLIKQ